MTIKKNAQENWNPLEQNFMAIQVDEKCIVGLLFHEKANAAI